MIECSVEILETRADREWILRDLRILLSFVVYFGNGVSAGVFPGGSGKRDTFSTIAMNE